MDSKPDSLNEESEPASSTGNGMPNSTSCADSSVSQPTAQEAEGLSEAVMEKYDSVRCLDLAGEWRRCISAYNQFHQYYIYGQYSSCKEEKARMYNCFKWKGSGNDKARLSSLAEFVLQATIAVVEDWVRGYCYNRELVKSLEEEQKNMHTPTPVWEMRTSPPSDWNK